MGLGILEPSGHNDVPGTARVLSSEEERAAQLAVDGRTLKYDKSGKVLLIPQPSDDPNDPLVRLPHAYTPLPFHHTPFAKSPQSTM
jgi:hypothetical protein